MPVTASTSYDGAGADRIDALALLSTVSPELYSLGQSNIGARADTLLTYVFAFAGVGGSVVVPPVTTPVSEPGTLRLMGMGLAGLLIARRCRA